MKYIALLASICGLTLAVTRVDPLVSTKVGLIRGLQDDNGYSKFLGVSYGKLDGDIFGAAVPHPAFEDIFEAFDDSNTCVQVSVTTGEPTGSTDCLNLNIFVPDRANSNQRLPVMLYIHGGGFVGGSASHVGFGDFLRHDVIVVSINYRVGIFGFMCLNTPQIPGNTGLKDQVLALRWVNENIEAFGGDANQITIFGGSAGGMSNNLHLFSLNEKLFNRVIIQSGPATSYWMMVESDTSIPIRISEHLGFNTTDMNEALNFLRDADAHMLALTAHDLLITSADGVNQPLTKPCVEQEFDGVEAFITEHPMNLKSSKASATSIIIGHNSIELAFQYANIEAEFFDTFDFRQLFKLGFDMKNDLSEALDVVKHFYIGDEKISEKFKWDITDFGSDFIFNHPTQRMAQQLLDNGVKTIFRYMLTYNGNNGQNKTWTGATHGEEISYFFDSTTGPVERSPEDQLVSDRLIELWTNFAKYGDPTPSTSELLPIKWTPITKSSQPYLEIDSDLKLKNRPFQDGILGLIL